MKYNVSVFWIRMMIIVANGLTFAAIPAVERNALTVLYNNTQGAGWTNNTGWKTPPLHTDGFAMPGTEADWYGVTLSSSGDHLENINLANNRLVGPLPAELGTLSQLNGLYLATNRLNGSIPPELGQLRNLRILDLDSNELSGVIPAELGDMSSLLNLSLNSNQLRGSIPVSLRKLVQLADRMGGLDFNALYADDPAFIRFLDLKFPGWQDVQTIAPINQSTSGKSPHSLTLNWTPILYTYHTGGYRVFYATDPAGPFLEYGMTADKSASSMTIAGLTPSTTYYFYIIARTSPHTLNSNTVDSNPSKTIASSTTAIAVISGQVFHDRNNNGVVDGGEEGLDQAEIIIDGPQGADNRMLTGSAGNYKFDQLLAGPYRMTLNQQTLPPDASGDYAAKVQLTPDGYVIKNFAIRFNDDHELPCDAGLMFVAGTPSWPGQGWDNAVDSDLADWDGTATVRGPEGDYSGPAWALFSVACQGVMTFDRIRIWTDNGQHTDAQGNPQVQQLNRQTQQLHVWTSSTGQADEDFSLLTTIERKGPGPDQVYALDDTVQARYFKLVIMEPNRTNGGWRQLVEFKPELGQALSKKAALAGQRMPAGFNLEQNYPNPFNNRTSIAYELTESGPVQLRIVDANGREIAALVTGSQSAGRHVAVWDAGHAASGIYFCELCAQGQQSMTRMLLVK